MRFLKFIGGTIVFYSALNGAFAQTKPDLAVGKPLSSGESYVIKSERLKEDREIRVFLPAAYAASKRQYPVIYAFDGEGTGPIAAGAVGFMTGYSAIPQMPESIVVAIVNTDRNRDMPIPQGYGSAGERQFLSFIVDELIPSIEQRYRTQPLRILLGHSQGGLFAHYAMSSRPDIFRWILSIDAPLSGFGPVKPIMDRIRSIASDPKFHGRLVTVENLYGWRKDWASVAAAGQSGFFGAQIDIKDETHETMAYKAVYEGLKRLFSDYAPNLIKARNMVTLPELEKRYSDLSLSYGYKVEIPQQVLLIAADQNIAVQHGAEALALAKSAVAIYGGTFGTERRINEAEAAVKKGRDPKLEEWAKLPLPSVESIKPFIGTWERRSDAVWMIDFQGQDGSVVAENTIIPPSFEPFHLEVQFVKVIDSKTIQWGERNGRGPGVTVFTATLKDSNTLEGTAEPFGYMMGPKPFSFSYKLKPAK